MLGGRVLAAILALIGACSGAAEPGHAQPYPARPIKIIVPTPAGGPVDTVARLVGHTLSTAIGQGVVIDNRPGAGNTIGSKEAAQAEPDGYTLLYSSASGLVIAPMLQKNAGYDSLTSYDPIALVAQSSTILVVHPSLPVDVGPRARRLRQSQPGQGELFVGRNRRAAAPDRRMVQVGGRHRHRARPVRGGGPSINDLVGGQVQMTFEGTSVLVPLIQAGKLRALATVSPTRIAELPDLPTMVESGFPGFVSTSWTGLLAPAKTPAEVISKLNAQINEAVKSPEFKSALTKLSNEPLGGTPQDFTNQIKADIAKWAPIVKALGL